jgi:rhamnogalacturonyl hydrolase YesR
MPTRPPSLFHAALTAVTLLAIAGSVRGNQKTEDPIKEDEVLTIARRVADWQLAHPNTLKEHEPTSWTEGALYTGIMALYRSTGEKRYLDAMLEMGSKNRWQLGPRTFFADDHAVGQTYCELYRIMKDPQMIAPMRAQFDGIIASPKKRDLEWPKQGASTSDFTAWGDRWAWCDALFMAPAAWARLYEVTGERRYLDFMDREWWETAGYLYDKNEGFFYRDSRFFTLKTPAGKKIFWGRGNGWVYAGITRVLDSMPRDYPSRPKYLQLYREMTSAVLKSQQPDGLWRPSLLDPDQVSVGETSGSAFFCYGLAWGINQGILDHQEYWPAVIRAWRALVGKVHPDGMLGCVQPIGGGPDKVDENSTEVYGVGAFLLAACEVEKCLKSFPVSETSAAKPLTISAETMAKLRSVVVRDWLNAPGATTNWLEDSLDTKSPAFPSNKAFGNADHIRKLMATQSADGSWPDVDYKSTPRQNWPALNHFQGHLHDLVISYALPGSPLFKDPDLKKKILLAIDWWEKNDFKNPNWWFQYIGMPAYYLGPVLLVMKDDLTPEELKKGVEILDRCNLKGHDTWRSGGNHIFDCRAALYDGLMSDDAGLIDLLYRRMIYSEYRFSPPSGSGIKEDFSEWEHGNLLFNHGYGALLIGEASRLLWYAHASGIPVDPAGLDFITRFLFEGSAWMSRGDFLDYSANGRGVVNRLQDPAGESPSKKDGKADSQVPSVTIPDGNYLVLGARYLQLMGSPRTAELKELINRSRGKSPAREGNRMFPVSDFMSHSRKEFYASVKMSSQRTINTETCNGQNRLGQHLGEGTMYIIRNGNEYLNIFPLWDWRKIPGTTVNLASMDDSLIDENPDSGWFPSTNPEEEGFGRARLRVSRLGRTSFVGGVSDGINGIAAMDLKVLSLQAHKSWFFLGNQIVCLGSGISDPSKTPVVTTVNQCLLKGAVRVIQNHGGVKTLSTGVHNLHEPSLVYHDDVAYLFPGAEEVVCSNVTQTGNWHRVDKNQDDGVVSKDVFSLWIKHGAHPKNASYAYIIAPGIGFDRARELVDKESVAILSNTDVVQAVKEKQSGLVGAVFHRQGILEIPEGPRIIASARCILLITQNKTTGKRQVAIASPDQAKTNINLSIDGSMHFINVAGGNTTFADL